MRARFAYHGPLTLALAAAVVAGACGDGDAGEVDARLRVPDVLGGADTAGYARAVEPRTFAFPDDHGPHPAFRTEWWYFTGNLTAPDGRRFGYQLTIFRVALAPPGNAGDARGGSGPGGTGGSAWATRQAYMGHLALTDVRGERFLTEERFARGAVGLAGAAGDPFRVWLEDWSVTGGEAGAFPARLRARGSEFALELTLDGGKPPVLHGSRGLSRKGPGHGNASYYYSLTRISTRGTVIVDGRTVPVEGLSWLDREWSTSALGPELEGWDWLSLQLDGGREIMIYRLRRRDGTVSPFSGGTRVEPDGSVRPLEVSAARFRPTRWWRPAGDAVRYPVGWSLDLPELGLALEVSPLLDAQEWRGAFRYWEGAVEARGRGPDGDPVAGRGYLELTGYGGADTPGSPGGTARDAGR